jgi:dTDP-glucose 4,6-dehydratase
MKVMLVTGGAGFIGSNFINYFLRYNKNYVIVNYDNLTTSGNINNLKDIERSPRYHFVKGSICNHDLINYVIKRHRPDYIINFASETSQEKSLVNPTPFFETNVMGTLTLLDSARYFWGKNNYKGNRFIQVSTNEVYGTNNTNENYFTEDAPLMPDNPYSASKASADLLVKTFSQNYDFPAIITRCCSTYGPYQNIDSFIPACIKSTLLNEQVRLSKDMNNGSYEWIHVLDHCSALIRILFYGRNGEIYNISSGIEASNLELAKKILKIMGKSEDRLECPNSIEQTRLYYGVNSYKIRNNLSWGHKYNLDDGLFDTIRWYKENRNWWDKNTE